MLSGMKPYGQYCPISRSGERVFLTSCLEANKRANHPRFKGTVHVGVLAFLHLVGEAVGIIEPPGYQGKLHPKERHPTDEFRMIGGHREFFVVQGCTAQKCSVASRERNDGHELEHAVPDERVDRC